MGGDEFQKGEAVTMKTVYISPDGGDSAFRFHSNTLIDDVINKLATDLKIHNSEPEDLMIAFGMSKVVHWSRFVEVRDKTLSQYLDDFPISEYQMVDGIIPLYANDTSYTIRVHSFGQGEEVFKARGTSTFRDVVKLIPRPRDGWPNKLILQSPIYISEEILDVELEEICVSKELEILLAPTPVA